MEETTQDELYLTVFLSGAHSPWGKEIDEFIETKLGHEIISLKAAEQNAPVNIEALEQDTEDCSFAIILLTDASPAARERLIHEIGYCQGTFGYHNVLVLRHESVPEFTNLAGILYEVFSGDNIKAAFPRIRAEIDAAIERFSSEEEEDED